MMLNKPRGSGYSQRGSEHSQRGRGATSGQPRGRGRGSTLGDAHTSYHFRTRDGSGNTSSGQNFRIGTYGRGVRNPQGDCGGRYDREGPARQTGRGNRDFGTGRGELAKIHSGSKFKVVSNFVLARIAETAPQCYLHRVDIKSGGATLPAVTKRRILSDLLRECGIFEPCPFDGENYMVATRPITIEDITEGRRFGVKGDVTVEISFVKGPIDLSGSLEAPTQAGADNSAMFVLHMILDNAASSKAPWTSGKAFGHEGSEWAISARGTTPLVKMHLCHEQTVSLVGLGGREAPVLAVSANIIGRMRVEETTLDELLLSLNLNLGPGFHSDKAKLVGQLLNNLKFKTKHGGRTFVANPDCVSEYNADECLIEVEGSTISLTQYYAERYSLRLRRPKWCVLMDSRNGKNFPAELLHIPSQSWGKKLQDTWQNLVTALLPRLAMSPEDRLNYIKAALKDAFLQNSILEQYGIELSADTVNVEAEPLKSPSVQYGSKSVQIWRGGWNLRGVGTFDQPAKSYACGLINLCPNIAQRNRVQKFWQELTTVCRGHGLDLNNVFDGMHYVEGTNWEKTFESLKNQRLGLIFVLIPSRDSTYNQIKARGDCVCPTQVLLARSTPYIVSEKSNPGMHLGNIALKVNHKLGGRAHRLAHTALETDTFSFLRVDDDTCILGADICHCGKRSVSGCKVALPSYAALTGTVDRECGRYTFSLHAQDGGQDVMLHMILQVQQIMERRAQMRRNPVWPSKVIYLRDGFSDTAIETIRQEALAIKEAYRRAGQKGGPQVLAIAVRKRQITRFFSEDSNGQPRSNLESGTVILDDLSMPSPYPNFYLMSHAGIKGTSVPTRFVVVHDDFAANLPSLKPFSQRALKKLYAEFCFHLCALFARCTRMVSYPAPVYNAHCLAERGQKISDTIASNLVIYPPPSRNTPSDKIEAKLNALLGDYIKEINERFSRLQSNLAWL